MPVYASPSGLGDFFGADPRIHTQNFNLNLQQQLSSRAVFQVGNVGARGTKLFRLRDLNQPSQAQITTFDPGPQYAGFTFPNCPIAGLDASSNAPRTVFPSLFYVNQFESTASSTYHALQTSLRVSNWHG
jgi:hypothetical protein